MQMPSLTRQLNFELNKTTTTCSDGLGKAHESSILHKELQTTKEHQQEKKTWIDYLVPNVQTSKHTYK